MASYVEQYLKDLETAELPGGAHVAATVVRGIPQNPSFDVEKFEDCIDNFVTKDGDVFVATYVKAGTTWTQQMIHCLLRAGKEGGKYGESVPWLEAAAASEFLGPREAPTWSIERINETPGPRYFKTHANVRDLPRGQAKIKNIIVARNPKDTAVSLYHHAKSKPEFDYKGDFETFLQIFLSGMAENGDWFQHALDWYEECKANPDTHLFLKYEDMHDDVAGAIENIATFLDIPCTEEILAAVVKGSSIGHMRENSSIGMNHLRKGGYGGWRSHFTVEMSELFDDVYAHKMGETGLKFNFGANSRGENVIM